MRAADVTTCKSLNAIGCKQSTATVTTRHWANWLLGYLATHPNGKTRFWQSNMRLFIHSDASFLVEWDGKSNYGGFFYLGWNQRDEEEQKINGAIEDSASILPLVTISVAEAEMGEDGSAELYCAVDFLLFLIYLVPTEVKESSIIPFSIPLRRVISRGVVWKN